MERAPPIINDDGSKRYAGTIYSFFPERKYGFIKCEAASEEFGFDTFLSDQELAGFTNGNAVSFSVRLNSHGKPQAHDLNEVAY